MLRSLGPNERQSARVFLFTWPPSVYCALAAWRPGSVTVNHLDLIKKNQGKICASALQNRCTTDYANTNVFKWVITQRCGKTSLGPPLTPQSIAQDTQYGKVIEELLWGLMEYDKPRLRVPGKRHQGASVGALELSECVRWSKVTLNKAWRKQAKPLCHKNLIILLDELSWAQWSLCVEVPEESRSLLAPVEDTSTTLLTTAIQMFGDQVSLVTYC